MYTSRSTSYVMYVVRQHLLRGASGEEVSDGGYEKESLWCLIFGVAAVSCFVPKVEPRRDILVVQFAECIWHLRVLH